MTRVFLTSPTALQKWMTDILLRYKPQNEQHKQQTPPTFCLAPWALHIESICKSNTHSPYWQSPDFCLPLTRQSTATNLPRLQKPLQNPLPRHLKRLLPAPELSKRKAKI